MPPFLKRLKRKAEKSPCKYKIAALGYNAKSEIVHVAFNSFLLNKKGGGIHAEEQIFKVAKRKNIKKILIIRVGKNGEILPIDPCPSCSKTAEKLGIKIESIKSKKDEV